MNRNLTLQVMSLLTLLLLTAHITHDTIRQVEGSMTYPIPVAIFAVWLYAIVVGPDRLWARIVMFFGGLVGAAMIVIHARGLVVHNSGDFFFVWTQFALSATGIVTMLLAADGWRRRTHSAS